MGGTLLHHTGQTAWEARCYITQDRQHGRHVVVSHRTDSMGGTLLYHTGQTAWEARCCVT